MTVNTLLNPELLTLRTLFQNQGFDLRFVGGCVRDTMLGLVPKDVDLHTNANPDEQVSIYQAAGVHYIETGLQHGTVTVVLNGVAYEITSLRQDAETDGRHATVVYTRDWHTDLERRDFRFNAMSMGFDGDLMDPFGGLTSLQNGLVEFVGDPRKRIQEDYLRILRWFRFRGRFGLDMSYSARRAVEDLAQGLLQVSRERVWNEVSRILAGENAPLIMAEMQMMGVNKWINLPGEGIELLEVSDVHNITRNPITVMVAMYGMHAVEALRMWKASCDEIQLATWLNMHHSSRLRLQDLLAVDRVCRDWVLELAVLRKEDAMFRTMLKAWTVPSFPVTGNDLLAQGFVTGPAVGKRLQDLKTAWAGSDYHFTRDQLLNLSND